MTLLAKILVYVNLALSLLMAAWGMALYTGRINWNDEKSSPEAGPSELKKITDKKTKLDPAVAAASARYADAAGQLLKAQQQRTYNVAWYHFAADRLQSGATEQQPADAPVLQGGLPIPVQVTAPNTPPLQIEPAKDRAGENLRSYAAYVNDLLSEQSKIKAEMDKLAVENKKYLDLSQQIVGVVQGMGANAKVVTPGLRQLLQDEETKLSKVLAQQEELRPLLVNSYGDIQLLAKRHGQLEKQVQGPQAQH
jgi:hypothetical protein